MTKPASSATFSSTLGWGPFFPLLENSGTTTADKSPTAAPALSLQGAASWQTVSGIGPVVRLGADGDYLSHADDAKYDRPTTAITLAVGFTPTSFISGAVFAGKAFSFSDYSYAIRVNGNNQGREVHAELHVGGTTYTTPLGLDTLTAGNNYILIARWSSGNPITFRVYDRVTGVQISTTRSSPASPTGTIDYDSRPFMVGFHQWRDGTPSAYLHGDCEFIAVDNQALTDTQTDTFAANPYADFSFPVTAGTVSTSAVTDTTLTLNTTAATGGTAPYSYQFQKAPDAAGAPGQWTDLGTFSSAATKNVTGLTASTKYWFRVVSQDSAGTPATVNSSAVSATTMAASTATGYTLTAPTATSGDVTVASGNFTVTPNGTWSGTITPHSSADGIFTPTSLTWAAESTAKTFTFTPSLIGAKTITCTNSGTLSNPAGVTFTGLIQLGVMVVKPNGTPAVCRSPDWGGFVPFPTGPYHAFTTPYADDAPVDPRSAAIISVYEPGGIGDGQKLWYYEGGGGATALGYGVTYAVVDSTTQPLVSVLIEPGDGVPHPDIYIPQNSDFGFHPLPDDAPIWTMLTTPDHYVGDTLSDCHICIFDRATRKYHDFVYAYRRNGQWYAGVSAVFDSDSGGGGQFTPAPSTGQYTGTQNVVSPGQLRRANQNSADAAGTMLLPFALRWDEAVTHGVIPHALRMSFGLGSMTGRFIYPARAIASGVNPKGIPYGARLRLKQSYYDANKDGFTGAARVVVEALRRYGVYNSDGGTPWALYVVPDDRWQDTTLSTVANIPGAAFEVMEMAPGFLISTTAPATITVGTQVSLTVTWNPPGDSGYNVECYLSSQGSRYENPDAGLAGFGASGSSFMGNLTPATPALTFPFTPPMGNHRLNVIQGGGSSYEPPSIPLKVSGTLPDVTLTVSNQTSTGLTLTASTPVGGTGTPTYRFQRSPDTSYGGNFTNWSDVGTPSSSPVFTDSGLTTGTMYHYQVLVTYSGTGTAISPPLTTSTLTPTPAAFQAGTASTSAVTDTTVTVTTTAATGGTAPYSYQFQKAPDVSGVPGSWYNVGTAGTATTINFTGFVASTRYWFRVLVTDSATPTPATAAATAVSATTLSSTPTPTPVLHRAVNNAGSTCAVLRPVGGTSLTVVSGASFGSPATSEPIYVSVHRGVTPVTILSCTGRSGNVLTVSAASTDAEVRVGDSCECLLIDSYINDLAAAIDVIMARLP